MDSRVALVLVLVLALPFGYDGQNVLPLRRDPLATRENKHWNNFIYGHIQQPGRGIGSFNGMNMISSYPRATHSTTKHASVCWTNELYRITPKLKAANRFTVQLV
ncbi:uncharacterized protein LOC134226157 [Armigeres subalbatus]|uniref:uncharacterized protein LOC134226157 n=1 Tax=Armigeres subalbatus TaxID=124917 RepID=UPI002ECFD202